MSGQDWWGSGSGSSGGDWYGGGSSSSGGDWYGGWAGAAPTKAEHENAIATGLLNAELRNRMADQPTHEGGLSGLFDNAMTELASTVTHIPTGLEALAKQAAFTVSPTGLRENITGSGWRDPRGLEGGALRPLVEGTLYDVGVGHMTRTGPQGFDTHFGDVGHRFYQNPLNLPLDILSVFTAGGSGALKAVKAADAAGVLAREGRLARLADDSARTVAVGGETENLGRARTLQGRLLEDAADRLGTPGGRYERYPLVGGTKKFQSVREARLRSRDVARYKTAQQAAAAFSKLTPDEQTLLHVAAQFRFSPLTPGETPIEQAIRLVRESPIETAAKDEYVKKLQRADPDVLTNPRPQFVRAVDIGRNLRETSTAPFIRSGRISAEEARARDLLPALVVSGARLGPSDAKLAYDAARQAVKDADKEGTGARRALGGARLRVAKQTGLGPDYRDLLTAAERMAKHGSVPLAERYETYAKRVRRLGQEPASSEEFSARGPGYWFQRAAEKHRQAVENLASKDRYDEMGNRKPQGSPAAEQSYADARNRMEAAKRKATAARKRLRETPKPGKGELEQLRGGKSLETLERYEREWLEGRREIPGLSRKFGPAYRFPHHLFGNREGPQAMARRDSARLTAQREPGALRFDAAKNLMSAAYTTHPNALVYDFGRSMGYAHQLDLQRELLDPHATPLGPGVGFDPAKERIYNPAAVKGATSLLRNQAALADRFGGSSDALARFAHEVILPQHAEYALGERLGEKGLMKVPKWVADRYHQEARTTSRALRLFWDRPTDVWRYLTLNLRPGWATTNLVSNLLMGALGASKDGPEAFLRAVFEVEKGDPKVFQTLSRWTGRNITSPTLRRAWQRRIDQVAELSGVNQGGLYARESRVTHAGIWQSDAEARSLAGIVRRAGKAPILPARAAYKAVRTFGDGVTRLNIALENATRQAAFLEDALPRLRDFYKDADNANTSLEAALGHLYAGRRQEARFAAQQAVEHANRLMGDFQNLGHFERAYVRRFFIFYSWYKVIALVSKNLLVDHPLRINLLMRAAQNTAPQDQAFPSFLQGALQQLPGAGPNTVISTTAANPFTTPLDSAEVAGGLAHGRNPPTGSESVLSLVNPLIAALYTGVTNQDSFTGGKNYAPGANQGVALRTLGALLNGIPEVGYGQHVLGDVRVPGTGFAPIQQPYRSPTYPDQTRLDYLLNYLGIPIKRVNRRHAALLAAKGD